jgi:CHAT domain
VRVYLDLEERADNLFILVSGPDGRPCAARPVTYAGSPGSRMLVERKAVTTVADPDCLVEDIDQGRASAERLQLYGELLFQAVFGPELWQDLLQETGCEPYLEIAIRGQGRHGADWDSLRWEALHDGTRPIAARGAARAPTGAIVPVGVVRLVKSGNERLFGPIEHIPRVLFAIGSRLTDRNVQAGAEFMGIMRHLERDGGSIHPRVQAEASLESLQRELATFKPDVMHLIGHGRRASDGQVTVQLHAETSVMPGGEWVTAEQLLGAFGEAGHAPAMLILSACATASVGVVNALPFAAQLVAGGVPVVVAMAGDIADTACRVFTRALTGAIGRGVPLGKAVIAGRQAAFHQRPQFASSHWIMPSVFLAEGISDTNYLVDVTKTQAIRTRVYDLGLAREPVFFGRDEFLDAMGRLLDGDKPLNVMLAYTPNPYKSYGGERLLRHLGAHAVREGVLPVLVAGLEKNPPTNRASLAAAINKSIRNTWRSLGLDEDRRQDSRAVAIAADPDTDPNDLAHAIRTDLKNLVDALDPTDPVRRRRAGDPQVVLLIHRVDGWLDALDDLLDMLGEKGLKGGAVPVPVVLTGADVEQLSVHKLRKGDAQPWGKAAKLDRFAIEDDEDLLAYQWWLLNPPDGEPVYAPRRDAPPGWRKTLRWIMRNVIYDQTEFFGWAGTADDYFTSERDDDLLASYVRVAP